MTGTKAGYKQQPALYQWSSNNCMGIFHSLNTFYQLEDGSIFPQGKLRWFCFRLSLSSLSTLLRIPCRLISKGLLFLVVQSTHIFTFNCFKTELMEYGCSRFSFTNNGCSPLCYGYGLHYIVHCFWSCWSFSCHITHQVLYHQGKQYTDNTSLVHRKSVWLMLKFISRYLKSDLTILDISTSELVFCIFYESKLPVCIKFIIKYISSISTVPQKIRCFSVKLAISGFTHWSKSHTSLVQLKEKQKLRKY